QISPSGRTSAAQAPGSTDATVTGTSSGSARGSGAVADGRSSRNATRSHSAARPANGRVTITSSPAPWQAFQRLPEPHGQGRRGFSPSCVLGAVFWADFLAMVHSRLLTVRRQGPRGGCLRSG